MGQIRNRNGDLFQPQFSELRHCSWLALGVNLVHDLVAPKIIGNGIARLDRMKRAPRRGRFEQRTQSHETVATTPRIESVEGDRVALVSREHSAVGQAYRGDSAVKT